MVTLIGGVVRDVEIKFLDSGQAAGKFALAVDNGHMKNGEWVKKVSFLEIVAYGKLAENAQASLSPGVRATVTGKASQRSWETADGSKRSVVEFIADDISVSLKFNEARTIRTDSPGSQSSSARRPAPDDDDVF
jgi:single-strand DNA-binding protein